MKFLRQFQNLFLTLILCLITAAPCLAEIKIWVKPDLLGSPHVARGLSDQGLVELFEFLASDWSMDSRSWQQDAASRLNSTQSFGFGDSSSEIVLFLEIAESDEQRSLARSRNPYEVGVEEQPHMDWRSLRDLDLRAQEWLSAYEKSAKSATASLFESAFSSRRLLAIVLAKEILRRPAVIGWRLNPRPGAIWASLISQFPFLESFATYKIHRNGEGGAEVSDHFEVYLERWALAALVSDNLRRKISVFSKKQMFELAHLMREAVQLQFIRRPNGMLGFLRAKDSSIFASKSSPFASLLQIVQSDGRHESFASSLDPYFSEALENRRPWALRMRQKLVQIRNLFAKFERDARRIEEISDIQFPGVSLSQRGDFTQKLFEFLSKQPQSDFLSASVFNVGSSEHIFANFILSLAKRGHDFSRTLQFQILNDPNGWKQKESSRMLGGILSEVEPRFSTSNLSCSKIRNPLASSQR